MTFVTYREPQASSQVNLLIGLLESGIMGLGMGKSYLAQLPSCALDWLHGARKTSWTWHLAAGLPAKYPEDTPPDTWILLLFLRHGDPGSPSLHRKHSNVSGL